MSIATEITRIQNNIASAYSKCEEKGATMPTTQNSANLADTIDSIECGGTYQAKSVSPTIEQQTITADDGYDALSSVSIGAVTNAIDSNIQANNIKKDITILGVTGTLEIIPEGGYYDIDWYQAGVILNKANNSNYPNNNNCTDARGLAITPYITIDPEDYGKAITCHHNNVYALMNDLDGNNFHGSATYEFEKTQRYDSQGNERYPNTINYTPLIEDGVEYCPIYRDYWQTNRDFTLKTTTRWVRFVFNMYCSQGIYFKIGDKILWQSQINTD